MHNSWRRNCIYKYTRIKKYPGCPPICASTGSATAYTCTHISKNVVDAPHLHQCGRRNCIYMCTHSKIYVYIFIHIIRIHIYRSVRRLDTITVDIWIYVYIYAYISYIYIFTGVSEERIPSLWTPICTSAGVALSSRATPSFAASEYLLPLKQNKDQLDILKSLESNDCVVVQGPPGRNREFLFFRLFFPRWNKTRTSLTFSRIWSRIIAFLSKGHHVEIWKIITLLNG